MMDEREKKILLNLFEELTYIGNTNRTFNALRKSFSINYPNSDSTNGFFGQIYGTFSQNSEIMNQIREQCENIAWISKIGIHIPSYKDQEQLNINPTININGINFLIGKTGVLELEDVQITSLIPNQTINMIINYQYE